MIKTVLEIISKIIAGLSKPKVELPKFEVINATKILPWHKSRTWSKRALKSINKIVVHQELGMGLVEQVNNYHITPGKQNHLSNKGAPHFAYHYGIDLNGTVYKVNPHSATVWHCKGQNSCSVGIMVAGDFSGENHQGKTEPTELQLRNLNFLLNNLLDELKLKSSDIYGHCDFGKPACPGYTIMNEINKRRTA